MLEEVNVMYTGCWSKD